MTTLLKFYFFLIVAVFSNLLFTVAFLDNPQQLQLSVIPYVFCLFNPETSTSLFVQNTVNILRKA